MPSQPVRQLLSATALLFTAHTASSAALLFPGCGATLQACINSAASGDTIQITTQAVIDEDISIIGKSVSVFARGTAARFAAGRTVMVNATGDSVITLRNLWLAGSVNITSGSVDATNNASVSLTGMQIDCAAAAFCVRLDSVANAVSTYTVNITQSRINNSASASPAISSGFLSGAATINITNNDVQTQTTGRDGIDLEISQNGRANVLANRVGKSRPTATGTTVESGIVVSAGTSGSPVQSNVQIARNVVYNFAYGISLISGGSASALITNNTISNADNGIYVVGAGLTTRTFNNLLDRVRQCGLRVTTSATPGFSAGSNMYSRTPTAYCPGVAVGAGDLLADAQFIGGTDFRTRGDSPNVNSGNNAEQPQVFFILAFVPTPDANGRAGRVGGTVDIGAYEFSFDQSFLHIASPSTVTGNLTQIQSPPVGLLSTDVLLLGQFGRDIDTTPILPSGLSSHLGVWWDTGPDRWTIFNQNNAGTLAANRRFFVLLNIDSNPNVVHIANAANSSGNLTTLDVVGLNNTPTALPIVTQRYAPGASLGVYNNSAIGVWYDTAINRWRVFNQAPAAGGGITPAMPLGAAFNVMTPNALFANGAFAYRTDPLSVPVTLLNLDHPLLNNTACAHPYVTSVFNPNNVYVPANLVVSYNPSPDGRGNWAIERGDGLQIPAGAAFHVYIDPQQSRSCTVNRLLSDGFES